jgi:hypothetical protein
MATETKTVQGTTLEILQAYPLGTLEVALAAAQHMGIRGRITGLGNGDVSGAEVYLQTDERGFSSHWTTPSRLLPVLRPFSQLCDLLPDGTVAAVEVAKMVMAANRPESQTPIASYADAITKQSGQIISVECHRATSYTLEVLIDATWAVCTVYDHGIWHAHNMVAIVDYLRRNQFALPINGRPLIEGVDYIAKTAACPTIEKEKKS